MGVLSLDVQIPEEEKELGPQDRLIHVYHFTRDASQNHMVCSSPFFNVCLYSATSNFFFSEELLMRAGEVIMNSVNATLCNKFCTLDLQSDYLICQNEVLPLFAS